ncbi:hypothetical protein M0805_004016 [Coniferiporia weirii]|nr:hypothetical protein M0805_004016 [Coniferiporia weirii]
MCGRFALGVPRQEIFRAVHEEHPNLDLDEWVDEEAFQPRFNVAPRSRSPVIRRRNRFDDGAEEADAQDKQDGQEISGQKHRKVAMHTMKWGLVPHWNKHEDMSLNTINAKGENLVDGGGMWTSIKGKKRCAVLCQGYYEWQKKGRDRLPHFTKHKDGKLMLLAGLYDSVTLEGSTEPLWTFTVVTTDANRQFSWLHDRMPIVLSTQAQLDAWLDTSSQTWSERAAKVIRPYNDRVRQLECYAVPTDVGKVGAESPTFIEPVAKRRDGIEAMFAKQSKAAPSSASFSSPAKAKSSSRRDAGTSSSAKRGRESLQVKGQREASIELLDSPPAAKRSRKSAGGEGPEKEERDETQSDEPKGTTKSPDPAKASPEPAENAGRSSPRTATKPRLKTESAHASPSPSPSTSKITKFFPKDSK